MESKIRDKTIFITEHGFDRWRKRSKFKEKNLKRHLNRYLGCAVKLKKSYWYCHGFIFVIRNDQLITVIKPTSKKYSDMIYNFFNKNSKKDEITKRTLHNSKSKIRGI